MARQSLVHARIHEDAERRGLTGRREWMAAALAAPLAAAGRGPVKLHLGTYGMQSLDVDKALATIRETGYDGAELCLMPGWPSEASKLDAAARRRIRETKFPIPTMIEGFNTLVPAAEHTKTLDRIRAAAALAHDLAPKTPAILQTVLGGKPAEWEQVKEQMAARLADWARVAAETKLPLAVKSHIGSASHAGEVDLAARPGAESGAVGYLRLRPFPASRPRLEGDSRNAFAANLVHHGERWPDG
jgi:hypothetical protein